MERTFIESMIIAVRAQMHALDESLSMLERELNSLKSEQTENDTAATVCPLCKEPVSDITAMGCAKPRYACTVCEFRGEI